ncbi:MAG: hypothetical protein CMJ81_13825 [Planctomycetaceae bacterium]|nr:hypothetical protein [Planctomycetaceae bacterium]
MSPRCETLTRKWVSAIVKADFVKIVGNGSWTALAADFRPDGNGSFRSHVGGGLFRSVTYTATTVQLQKLLALA